MAKRKPKQDTEEVTLKKVSRESLDECKTASNLHSHLLHLPPSEQLEFFRMLVSKGDDVGDAARITRGEFFVVHGDDFFEYYDSRKQVKKQKRKPESKTERLPADIDALRKRRITIDQACEELSRREDWKGTEPSSIRAMYYRQMRKSRSQKR